MGYIITTNCKCMAAPEEYFIGLGFMDYDKTYENELAYCEHCQSFYVAGDNNLCQCGHLGHRIYTADMFDDVSAIKCPRCGGSLSIEQTGFWD